MYPDDAKEEMSLTMKLKNHLNRKETELSAEAITIALFEKYEGIYDIDVETSAYQCFFQSESYSRLNIQESGDDFFADLRISLPKHIHPDDVEYVYKMMDRTQILNALENEEFYSFVYRLSNGSEFSYYKVRITLGNVGGRTHFLLGVRDVDETVRQEKAHSEALASMQQKAKNHMEAILASAAGYLEVNLTQDVVLEWSPPHPFGMEIPHALQPESGKNTSYASINQWLCSNKIADNLDRYELISGNEYLLSCFFRGEKRASVLFSVKTNQEELQPCREIFHLYRDDVSGDVMAFCVIYDLTEQQRRDQELSELEEALQMSRIQNSTSQMQPHFLYNALGSIQEIILDDPEYASDLVGDFTTHLRSCIRAMSSDALLPFEQELDNVRAYVNIEKMRFGDKLKVAYDIPTTDFKILPLSVQPLVENAIRHGIYHRGQIGGTVIVRTREFPDSWLIEVEDDGIGFDVEAFKKGSVTEKKDSTGLNNISFRLEKVMNAQINIESTQGTGTTVSIQIPKEEAKK